MAKKAAKKKPSSKGAYGLTIWTPASPPGVAKVITVGSSPGILACGTGALDSDGDQATGIYGLGYTTAATVDLTTVDANAVQGTVLNAAGDWIINDPLVPVVGCKQSPRSLSQKLVVWATYTSDPTSGVSMVFNGQCNTTTDTCSGSYAQGDCPGAAVDRTK